MVEFTLIRSGEEFELFCEDLLKAKGFRIISRPSRGPDGGKDIKASLTYTDKLGLNVDLLVLVECKHFAKSDRSVRESDVGNIIERTLMHNCNRYLLITSTVASTSVVNQLEGISLNPAIQIYATFWAKNNLDEMLMEFPELKKRYFSDNRRIDLEPAESEKKLWNIIIHEHPDFSEELKEIIEIWNDSQHNFLFSAVRPSKDLERQLLSSGKIHEEIADKIADQIRKEAGFNSDDEMIQFCEKRLHGEEYYQLFSSGTLQDEEPPNTSTISLDFMRKLARGQTEEAPLLAMILQTILHVITSGIGIEPHDETKGCIMDFDENMEDILIGLKNGPKFCSSCQKQLKRMGAVYILNIAEQTKKYLNEEGRANKVSLRMNLREKRRVETGEDWSYDVAFSFAGKDRELVEELASVLKKRNVKIFYDEFEKSQLWGEDLYSYLDELYRFRSKFCVVFISKYYANTIWNDTIRKDYERRAFLDNQTSILPIRLDDTEIPGISSSTVYIRWQDDEVDNIADMIVQKVQAESGVEVEVNKDAVIGGKIKRESEECVVSPFIFNNPVTGETFFNRENVLEDMLNYLFRRRDRGNIWLLGQRQSGKTSILKHLETEFNKIKHKTNKGQLVKFIYFDCQAVSNKALLFDEIASKIGLNLDLSHKSTIRVASDYFTSVFKQILEKNYYIILLLDEFDALLDYHGNRDERIKAENVVKDIRVRINGIPKLPRQPKLISAVFASDRRYKDLASHFKIGSPLNYFEIELEWFDDTQIEKLIQQYLPNDYSIFNHNDIHLCFQLSQGHPKLVQKVLDLIYCQKMAGKMDKKVIKEDTKEFIQKTPTVICNLKVPGYIKTRLNEIGVKVGNVDSIFMSNKEDYDE